MKNYPTIHIAGSTGARAAVLAMFPSAKPLKTDKTAQSNNFIGHQFPVYNIVSKGEIIGHGAGTSEAWENAAGNIY